MNPDTPDEVEIGYSSSRMLPLVALAATMTLLSASIAFDWFGDGGLDRYHALAGYVGLIVFGAATCRLIWLLLAARGPVLLIGRYGIRDLRVANEFILWDSIVDVSTCESRRRKFIVLKITPALEQHLHQQSQASHVACQQGNGPRRHRHQRRRIDRRFRQPVRRLHRLSHGCEAGWRGARAERHRALAMDCVGCLKSDVQLGSVPLFRRARFHISSDVAARLHFRKIGTCVAF
jgi:hypothetical protein